MDPKKYVAEFVATFLLTLAVLTSLTFSLPLATPIAAGLTLMIMVYAIGPISGAHLNPAVTLSLLSIKKVSNLDAVLYIVAQLIGAVAAMGVLSALGGSLASVGGADSVAIFVAEALGAFVLLFGIAAVVHGKVDDDASGITIGGSLLLGILLAAGASNGVLNPAVAIGIGSISATYILAPIVGGLIAVWVYKYVAK
jgi:aquaporin Z